MSSETRREDIKTLRWLGNLYDHKGPDHLAETEKVMLRELAQKFHGVDLIGELLDDCDELQSELERVKAERDAALKHSPTNYVHKQMYLQTVEQLERVKAENELLREMLKGSNDKLRDVKAMFYGQGYELANWHHNGQLESMDNFFEENNWEPNELEAHKTQGGEYFAPQDGYYMVNGVNQFFKAGDKIGGKGE